MPAGMVEPKGRAPASQVGEVTLAAVRPSMKTDLQTATRTSRADRVVTRRIECWQGAASGVELEALSWLLAGRQPYLPDQTDP